MDGKNSRRQLNVDFHLKPNKNRTLLRLCSNFKKITRHEMMCLYRVARGVAEG